VYADDFWDGDSNRVQLDYYDGGENSYTYQFVYDPTAGIPAVVEEVLPSEESAYYIREPGGEVIARYNETDGWRYYHFDALGSTKLLTDEDGDVTDSYTYDAWGNLLEHYAYTGTIEQPYQFVGQLGYYTQQEETSGFGFLQLGVRFYDPEIGRFTQRDPVASHSVAAYAYCADRPARAVDPSGLAVSVNNSCNADPSSDVPVDRIHKTPMIERAARQVWEALVRSGLGAIMPCSWRCMREYFNPDSSACALSVSCGRCTRGDALGESYPSLGTECNSPMKVCNLAFEENESPQTSLAFILCHEAMHYCFRKCKLDRCYDSTRELDGVINNFCEMLFPGQRP